jgi:hypothetical protein
MDWLFHLLGICPDHAHFYALAAGVGVFLSPAVTWVRCRCRHCWRCLTQLLFDN